MLNGLTAPWRELFYIRFQLFCSKTGILGRANLHYRADSIAQHFLQHSKARHCEHSLHGYCRAGEILIWSSGYEILSGTNIFLTAIIILVYGTFLFTIERDRSVTANFLTKEQSCKGKWVMKPSETNIVLSCMELFIQ